MAVGAVLAGVSGSAGIVGMFLGVYPPLLDWYTQEAYLYKPWKIPDLGTAVELRYKKQIGQDKYRELFGRSGLNPDYADKIFNMSEQLLSGYEYVTLWRRGRMSEENLDDRLQQLHYSVVDSERLKAVTEFFPSPGDLITFAVREVYTPEIATKFGQLDDLPPKFLEEAQKVGVPDEQAKNYWASHWMLPSVLQGNEMLHRRVIDRETHNMLLKALDIMPYWRKALTDISYRTLTRVDVRRMYGIGTLDEDQVYESYLDHGYSPDNAEKMTEFTKLYEDDGTTGLTRSAVMKAYKIGLITRSDMKLYFESFGYSEDVINFWVDTTDYELALQKIETTTSELKDQFFMGTITLTVLRQKLSDEELPTEYIQQVVDEVEKEKPVKVKLPTRTDLERWLRLNIITDVDYTESMRMMNYRDDDILLYLEEITTEVDTSVRKYLGIKTYTRWLLTGIITQEIFVDITTKMEYSNEDIDRMITEVEVQKDERERSDIESS